MQLFGAMEYKNVINERVNFSTFGWAFFTLFTCCTGENWSQVEGPSTDQSCQPRNHMQAEGERL